MDDWRENKTTTVTGKEKLFWTVAAPDLDQDTTNNATTEWSFNTNGLVTFVRKKKVFFLGLLAEAPKGARLSRVGAEQEPCPAC